MIATAPHSAAVPGRARRGDRPACATRRWRADGTARERGGDRGHHPQLFRRWLQTGSALYPGSGRLSARDSELLVLRTAAAMRSRYEWDQHASSGRESLSDEEIAPEYVTGEVTSVDGGGGVHQPWWKPYPPSKHRDHA